MKKVIILAAFSLTSLFAKAEEPALFSIDDYLALQSISELSVSPDGTYVAYTVTSNDIKKDSTRDTVWMLSTGGGE